MRIFVGNLARDVTEAELQQAFAEFGHISSVAILKDRETGEPRGFGFVEMPDDAEARRALAGLSGRALKGRVLRVDEARPREERGPSRSNGFDGRRAERGVSQPPARGMEREAGRFPSRAVDRDADRGWDRDDSRRPARGGRDARDDGRRFPRDDWEVPPVPLGDDWSSPPRGVDDGVQSTRGNRNSRATGRHGRDDRDGDDRRGRSGRSGGRGGRGRRNRYEEDEDIW